MIVAIFILYILAYIYAIEFAPWAAKHYNNLNEIHESCFVCGTDKLTHARGDQYYIGTMSDEKKKDLKKCVMTFWGFTHYILYAMIGYVAPDMFWETFAIGIGFEYYEKIKYNCEDPLDIAWNSLGFATGAYIKQFMK